LSERRDVLSADDGFDAYSFAPFDGSIQWRESSRERGLILFLQEEGSGNQAQMEGALMRECALSG